MESQLHSIWKQTNAIKRTTRELFKEFEPSSSCNIKLKDLNYIGCYNEIVKIRVTCKANKQKKIQSCGNKYVYVCSLTKKIK